MTVGTNNLPTDGQLDGIVSVLDAVRSGLARTKPEITRRTGLGRNSVTQWVNQLVAIGLLEEQGFAASSGGRNPRALRFGATLVKCWWPISVPGISAQDLPTY